MKKAGLIEIKPDFELNILFNQGRNAFPEQNIQIKVGHLRVIAMNQEVEQKVVPNNEINGLFWVLSDQVLNNLNSVVPLDVKSILLNALINLLIW